MGPTKWRPNGFATNNSASTNIAVNKEISRDVMLPRENQTRTQYLSRGTTISGECQLFVKWKAGDGFRSSNPGKGGGDRPHRKTKPPRGCLPEKRSLGLLREGAFYSQCCDEYR